LDERKEVTASEEIRATKELLMETRWIKRSYVSYEYEIGEDNVEDGVANGYCLVGALGMAVHEDPEYWSNRDRGYGEGREAIAIIYEALPAKFSYGLGETGKWGSIEDYNDHDSRTFDDVCDLLDRAEKLALIREEPIL
jgi:hypothetical protein